MKVFVVTKAEFMQDEVYQSVHSSKKAAEKSIRNIYPNARKDTCCGEALTTFLCREPGHDFLMFIHTEDI